MPFVLALAGSPRRHGNSETLLDRVLSGTQAAGGQVEKLVLNELNIAPCQECGDCYGTGICTTADDMRLVYDKLDTAGVVILASPIFFSGVSAQTKAMIDRCQAHWIRKYLLKQNPHQHKRPGAFISVRGQTGLEIFQAAAKPVRALFATEDIAYTRELLVDRTDAKGAIDRHPNILEEAYRLGEQLIFDSQ